MEFKGSYERRLDNKRRFSLPPIVREALGDTIEGVILSEKGHTYIGLYPNSEARTRDAREELTPQDAQTLYIKNERLTLPISYHAITGDHIRIIGARTRVELWDYEIAKGCEPTQEEYAKMLRALK